MNKTKVIRYIKKNLCQHRGKQNHYKQIKLQLAPHNNESTMWMFGSLFFTRKPQKGAVFLKKFMTVIINYPPVWFTFVFRFHLKSFQFSIKKLKFRI